MIEQSGPVRRAVDPATASTAQLVQLASEQARRLVRDELALARLELAAKGRRFGIGAGLLAGAGVLAGYGGGVLIVATVLLLDLVLPAWLAALIVSVALLAVAGVLALLGQRRLKRMGSPVPAQAIASIKADVRSLREALRRGRRG